MDYVKQVVDKIVDKCIDTISQIMHNKGIEREYKGSTNKMNTETNKAQSENRTATKPCSNCNGTMEWWEDFTFRGTEIIIHRCTTCHKKTSTEYAI